MVKPLRTDKEQQLAKIIGNHDAESGVWDAPDKQMNAQDKVGNDKEQGTKNQADILVLHGCKAHSQQQKSIGCYSISNDFVLHSGEYPAHSQSIYTHNESKKYQPDGLRPCRLWWHQDTIYNNVCDLCESEEANLGDKFILPAHHIAQKGKEESCRQSPLLPMQGTQCKPKQRQYHSAGERHRHEIQCGKNDINENYDARQFHNFTI